MFYRIFTSTLLVVFAVALFSCGSETTPVNQKPIVSNESPKTEEKLKEVEPIAEQVAEKVNAKDPDLLEIYVGQDDEIESTSSNEKDDIAMAIPPKKDNLTPKSPKEDTKPKVEAKPKPKPKPKKSAKIEFKNKVHKYGVIMQGTKIDHAFHFKNTGKAELTITNVEASCGCTQPSFPFLPIMPGESGKIDVNFNSTGKLGPQKPMITVYTNVGKYKLYLDGIVDAERAKSQKTPNLPEEAPQ